MFIKTGYKNFDVDGRITGDLYVDRTAELYLFGYNSKYYISETLGITLQVTNGYAVAGEYTTEYYTKGSKNYWYFNYAGGRYIWYDIVSSKYILSSGLGFGIDESDNFWSSSSLTGTYTFNPDAETPQDDATVAINDVVGWENTTLLGKYTAVGGESGNKYVGVRKFKDAASVEYIQSAEKSGSYYTYGTIHHDGTGWIIGTRDTGSWWTGSEPDVDSPVTFTMQGEAEANKIITFDSYIVNPDKTTGYIFEANVLV